MLLLRPVLLVSSGYNLTLALPICINDVDCCFGLLTLQRRFMLHFICFLSVQTKIIYDIYMLANLSVTRSVST